MAILDKYLFAGTTPSVTLASSSSVANAKYSDVLQPESEGRWGWSTGLVLVVAAALVVGRGDIDSSSSGCGSKFATSTFPGQSTMPRQKELANRTNLSENFFISSHHSFD